MQALEGLFAFRPVQPEQVVVLLVKHASETTCGSVVGETVFVLNPVHHQRSTAQLIIPQNLLGSPENSIFNLVLVASF